MRDRLAHRGPDGVGKWHRQYRSGFVAMGFRRLKIVDLRSAADQPMLSVCGRKVICFNGEIYNYLELREELEGKGHVFRTQSDTEVLLQAYSHWGDAMLERLNGMFAFVIWDEDRQRALVARDRFGEKPLFVGNAPDGAIIFASEMKAMFGYPGFAAEIDEQVAEEVSGGRLLYGAEETLFKRIRQFPPASTTTVSAAGKMAPIRRYWQVNCDPEHPRKVDRSVEREFVLLLERAVRNRLRCDVSGTAALSGGLDSSTLVSLISQMDSPGFMLKETISVNFPDCPSVDETEYQKAVSTYTGIDSVTISPSPAELRDTLRKLHWHHEGIVAGPSMFAEWCIMKWARENGYKIIIDGQGADEILAGYKEYWEAFQFDSYATGSWFRYAWNVARKKKHLLTQWRARYGAASRPLHTFCLSRRQLASYWDREAVPTERAYHWPGAPKLRPGHVMRFYLGAHLIKISLPSNLYAGDRTSMAHGVEARYPYLDYDLVDFCMTLEDSAFIRNGWQKWLLRYTMRNRLPKKVVWRPDKIGYEVPQDRWIANELSDWIEDRVFDPRLRDFRYYDLEQLRSRWREHRMGKANHSDEMWRWASLGEFYAMVNEGVWERGGLD